MTSQYSRRACVKFDGWLNVENLETISQTKMKIFYFYLLGFTAQG